MSTEPPINSPERIHAIEARLAALEVDANHIKTRQTQLYQEKDNLQEQITDLARQMHNLRHPSVVQTSPGHMEIDGKKYMLEEGGERSA